MHLGKLHILLLLLLLAVSCKGPHKIPRQDMVDIMVDMLIQDQQLKQDLSRRNKMDSTLVYEGIFQAYGYDTDDFRYSVAYYLEDPSRMEKIMNEVGNVLTRQSKETAQGIKLDKWRNDLMRIYLQKPDTTAPRPRVRAVDTLKVRFDADSVWMERPVDSLQLVPKDSLLFVTDSL